MRFLSGGLVLVILMFGLLFWGQSSLKRWSEQPRALSEAVIVDFPRGTSLRQLSVELRDHGLIDRSVFFQLWIRFFGDFRKFQAGMYRFEGPTSPLVIASKIIRGDNYVPVVLEVAVPEGFTLTEFIARLAAKGVGKSEDLWRLAKSPEFLKLHGITGTSAEGYIYPATYQFTEFPTPEQVFGEAIDAFWKKLPENFEARAVARGLTLQQSVTFASLIEAETAEPSERPFISEVIWRRLQAREPLAIDASIIYGIAGYNGNLTRENLQDSSNPYNTRVRAGLPPGPICSPASASLEAVLTPSDFGYYYYVLDPQSEKKHHFSKTAEEHNLWVRKLVQFQRSDQRAERRERLAREKAAQ